MLFSSIRFLPDGKASISIGSDDLKYLKQIGLENHIKTKTLIIFLHLVDPEQTAFAQLRFAYLQGIAAKDALLKQRGDRFDFFNYITKY